MLQQVERQLEGLKRENVVLKGKIESLHAQLSKVSKNAESEALVHDLELRLKEQEVCICTFIFTNTCMYTPS